MTFTPRQLIEEKIRQTERFIRLEKNSTKRLSFEYLLSNLKRELLKFSEQGPQSIFPPTGPQNNPTSDELKNLDDVNDPDEDSMDEDETESIIEEDSEEDSLAGG